MTACLQDEVLKKFGYRRAQIHDLLAGREYLLVNLLTGVVYPKKDKDIHSGKVYPVADPAIYAKRVLSLSPNCLSPGFNLFLFQSVDTPYDLGAVCISSIERGDGSIILLTKVR